MDGYTLTAIILACLTASNCVANYSKAVIARSAFENGQKVKIE